MDLKGFTAKAREFYFGLEDKWYALIDRVDAKLPVHGFVDRVDKVVPSFALFLVLVALLIAALLLPVFLPMGPALSVKVVDSDNAAVENASVEMYVEGSLVFSGTTNSAGETQAFALPAGTSVTIIASKQDFREYTETVSLGNTGMIHRVVLESLEAVTYTIALKDALGQPIRAPLTLSFSCRNTDAEAPADLTVSSGTAVVTEPAGCNGLVVSVKGEGFEFRDSVELVQNQQTIYMQESLGETATINVDLYLNNSPVSENVTVYLYKDNGTEAGFGPVESGVSENGRVVFEREPDRYIAKTSGQGSFAASASQPFSVSAGEVKTVRIDLQINIVGTIKLKIVDKVTRGLVDGANVLLRLGNLEVDSKVSSDASGSVVEFPVSQDATYTVVIDHEAYCLKTVHDARIGSAVREIELTPFSDDCGGKLRVKVLSQDGFPVRNATVGLYGEEGFSTGFADLVTDINGMAEFSRVPSGNYKAFAFKMSSSGWSDAQHFAQRAADRTVLTVVLIAGNGTIRVNVSDSEGTPLQFASVAFVDALTLETIGGGAMPVEDANGGVELRTRADKMIYIVASKQGYTNFTSTVKQVFAETTQVIDAVLEKEIIQGEIKAEFRGVYKNGSAASVLAPGEEYEARFLLKIPANTNYDSIGMHIRTGSHEIMELDRIVLKEINAPGDVDIIRATSYSPGNGYAVDSGKLSSDEAKWASLRWPVFSSGLMQVSARIKVKETATLGEQLNIFYRAWGEDNGVYKRDPLDLELGEAESVAGKNGLYANAHQEIFQIGTENLCDGKFCFSASILDIEDNLVYSASEGFSGGIFRPYKLSFNVLNDSAFETDSYMDSELRISSFGSGLNLQGYSVYGAQNQQMQGTAADNETGWIETGNFLPKNIISGEINFLPEKSGPGSIIIEVRSGQRVRFSRTVAVNIVSSKKMDVLVEPELLPSGIENSLTVTVKNKATGAEIAGAVAKVRDRFGTVIAEKATNSRGIAVLKLPGLQPGEKLVLLVGKPDFEGFEKELKVNPNVIRVKPSVIGVSLNAKNIFESQGQFSIENAASFDLKIKSIELNGKLYGLIDREKINNWLYSYAEEAIAPGEVKELQLRSFISEKGKRLEQPEQLEASLDITTEAFGGEWVAKVPVKISIGLGGEVDDPGCFTVTRKEWKASTEGMPVEIQFEAQNNCSVSNAEVPLRNISAKVDWQTNPIGTFSARTANNAIDLASGYGRKLEGSLGPGESISIVLTFSPHAGISGKGVASIVFSAENPTESGSQLLTDKIAAEITAVNLLDCIAFSKEVLVIAPGDSDSFGIETIGCGPRNELKLESDLSISSESVVLGENDGTEIEVLAEKNIPGQYPINVYVKGSDEVQFKFIKTIRARILSGGCLDLSRYEFDIFDNPENPYDGYDTAELENRCYSQEVTVTVNWDEHDWGDAISDGLLYGVIMGLMGGISAKMDGRSFWNGKAPEAIAPPLKPPTTPDPGAGEVEQLDYREPDYGDIIIEDIPEGEWIPPAVDGTGEFVLSYPTGYSVFEGMPGSMLLSNLINGFGKSLLGESSFLGWGLEGFVLGTILSYMSQGSGEFTFITLEDDLAVAAIELLMPGASLEGDALTETPSEGIEARDLEETRTEPLEIDPTRNKEVRKIGFLNTGGLVQEDPSTPFYRVLRVEGDRVVWETEYEMDESSRPEELEAKEKTAYTERFRLQFNAFDPIAARQESKPIPNCTLGSIVGVTGPNAVPKVSLDWSWSKIGENTCDEGNPDYVYCDATQFSIEVLKKVQQLRAFIEANKPFSCPTSASAAATSSQPLVGTAYDVGITKISAAKSGSGDANVSVIVESNNAKLMQAEVRIDLKQGSNLVKSCTKTLDLISKTTAWCEFKGVPEGEYKAVAALTPSLCQGCENSDSGNDSIEASLVIGSTGTAKCEPYSTERLPQFLEASGFSQVRIEQVQRLVTFNAYLMKDAYTNDFRADFDRFCKEKSFFDCPNYYLDEETGLHRLFSGSESFEFDYSMAPHAPADAGKYAVTLNIEFDNANWEFFGEGQPGAKVIVEMVELAAPEPDSPFYYLPFDGMLGVDSENGRQGYGVNFRQTSEETIKVNNAIDQTIISTNIPNSTPVFNGWIEAGFNDDFSVLNQSNRGILLDVRATGDGSKVVLSPSYATPVMMKVDYEKGLAAYGFYSVEIGQNPQTAFMRMVPWSGIGANCRDFLDSPVTEAWQDTWDLHGGISGNLSCAVGTDITDYGVEWCNPIRAGSVFLQGVVFTPQNSSSVMKRAAYSDEMTLYNSNNSGSQIALNGVPGMQKNSYGTSGIDSIEDVFELVRENKVCLVGQGNRSSNKFFWNPKVVLEELSHLRGVAEENCIQSS